MNTLLSSFKLGKNTLLKNRFALAPMTTQQSNPDGTVSIDDIEWYERIAKGGTGMIISCATATSKEGIGWFNQIYAYDDSMLPGLTELAKRLKKFDTVNIIQLCHTGSRAVKKLNGGSVYSASAYPMPQIPGFVPSLELSKTQIEKVITEFADAAYRVYKAGFHGVEIHGANGYLITQFISRMSNLRNDEFGGTIENRARLATEIVKACKKRVPDNFIVGFRLTFENAGLETGLDVDENIKVVELLKTEGIDYLHISTFDHKDKSIKYPKMPLIKYITERIKGIPIIGVGMVKTMDDINNILEYGVDIIALGRISIGNPEYVNNLKNKNSNVVYYPYDENHLISTGISNKFLEYLKTGLRTSAATVK